MRRLLLFALALGVSAAPLGAQAKREPLADRVKKSIDAGAAYMKRVQRANGSWDVDGDAFSNASVTNAGGKTALATLAMLNAGFSPKDPAVARALANLRAIEPDSTYTCGLQLLVYAEAGLPEDRQRIQDNVRWLLEARVYRNNDFIGWSYSKKIGGGVADNSNTQYAVLGLWAAKQAGIVIQDSVWKEIRDYYTDHQEPSGGWNYAVGRKFGAVGGVSITMTSAGLCGLLIAGMEMNLRREVLNQNGTATNCGKYDENPPVQKALNWLGVNFTPDVPGRTFYHLYGIERAGRLSGLRFFGNHDWYREGCEFLVERQRPDGSWQIGGAWDNWPVVSTSFALLFLSKGRTPVLMSKLVHGPWPRVEADTDWNNDRNDLRHLVSYASTQMFKTPLAWQTFDVLRGLQAQAKNLEVTENDYQAVTSEMLQTPILYITGHRSPLNRIQGAEKVLLKRYVENGGFILAEACCGSKEFDDGLKLLIEELWPGASFDLLPAEHPVYTAYAPVTPKQPYTIWGLNQGCKTVLVYSPQDLSCRWEKGKPEDPECVQAFRIGANIIAYVTGMEPPQPRLTQIKVAGNKTDPDRPPRGYVQVAQLKVAGENPPAPRAMRNLLEQAQDFAGLDVALATKHLFVGDRSVLNYKFVYLHGRKDFRFDPEELGHLRFNLQSGGLLLADACCGKEAFDQAFRKFVGELLPKSKLEQVPLNDELFSADLNGAALTEETIQIRTEAGGSMRRLAPYLEGIKHQGRWIVLYSKYDIGCALERHQASDCRGYSPESAHKIARAALLYTLRP